MDPRTVIRGGVHVESDSNGNLEIRARGGGGEIRVQRADVPDLILALSQIVDVVDKPSEP